VIPPVDANTGLLPVGKHVGTLDDVRRRFVDDAPFSGERERPYRALEFYLSELTHRFGSATVLLNGGFVTHKHWAAPKDIDLAVGLSNKAFRLSVGVEHAPLWTLQNVVADEIGVMNPQFGARFPRVQPALGLIDGFFFPSSMPTLSRYWELLWSKVKDENGDEVVGVSKGFVEVSL
jgi:hypothetical protein